VSLHFHKITVRNIRRETPDCISVSFDIPGHLENEFRFVQGQNITIRKNIDGEELRRNYSICSAPGELEFRVAIKQMNGGKFSTWANQQLREGDVLELLPPTGKFNTPLNPSARKKYLAFAAGSGITPIMSILKSTLQTEPLSQFTLVYGNRNRKSIIFREELENLKNTSMDRLQVIHILSREMTDSQVNHGRINTAKCEELCNRLLDIGSYDEIFICGPEEMIFGVKKFLEEKGVLQEQIHFELFTTPVLHQKELAASLVKEVKNARTISTIHIRLDGIVSSFPLSSEGDTILNAALKHGIDLPFACKGGVCSTCRARLQEGQVEMDLNYALEAEEVEKGFILTCQSHPKTDSVFVDFDAR
jgi:ring-1,2-phenylacetyl-CoA epoxidase subunit PaaE